MVKFYDWHPNLSLQQQTCKACGNRDKFDFDIPDEVWEEIVPSHLRNRVVCLACFDDFAELAGVDYAGSISTLYFAGEAAALIFETTSSANKLSD